jgi:magnesium chelatase accessory protein
MSNPLASPDWQQLGPSWPSAASSRFVQAGALRWHVQRFGSGPVALLLHGTGTAGHSFDPLAHQLARHFTVVIPDLPGHAFTTRPASPELSLPAMSAAVATLLQVLGDVPSLVVGHSAGAAVMCRLALDAPFPAARLVGVAPALWLPSSQRASALWPLVARLAKSEWLARFLSRRLASRRSVDQLARRSGSTLALDQLDRYAMLASAPGHIFATLAMMAEWDVVPLQRDLGRLPNRTLFLAGARDPWFPPANVAFAASHLPHATAETVTEAGHFLHEERADEVATRILRFADLP